MPARLPAQKAPDPPVIAKGLLGRRRWAAIPLRAYVLRRTSWAACSILQAGQIALTSSAVDPITALKSPRWLHDD